MNTSTNQSKLHATARQFDYDFPKVESVFDNHMEELSHEQLVALRNKFRNKRDLYSYLDQQGESSYKNVNLPRFCVLRRHTTTCIQELPKGFPGITHNW